MLMGLLYKTQPIELYLPLVTRHHTNKMKGITTLSPPMRFSVTFPDDLVTQIDHKARDEGITRAEWIRDTCTRAITTQITTLEKTIEDLRTENFYHLVDNAKLTSKCEELQEVINTHKSGDRPGDQRGDNVTEEITRLRLELQHREEVIVSQKDEIGWLRGEVAKLNDRIPMLPAARETPWWMFWR